MAGNALVDYATEHLLGASVHGHCPHAVVCVPFGDLNSAKDLFPAHEFSSVNLRLTGESGAGAIRVVTQQLRM